MRKRKKGNEEERIAYIESLACLLSALKQERGRASPMILRKVLFLFWNLMLSKRNYVELLVSILVI
jgi:hypothetical protein